MENTSNALLATITKYQQDYKWVNVEKIKANNIHVKMRLNSTQPDKENSTFSMLFILERPWICEYIYQGILSLLT